MKRNNRLLVDILSAIESSEDTAFEIDYSKFMPHNKSAVDHHLHILVDKKLITAVDPRIKTSETTKEKDEKPYVVKYRLTWDGHDWLAISR